MATISNDRDLALRGAATRVEYSIEVRTSNNNIILAADNIGTIFDNTLANVAVAVYLDGLVDTGWTLSMASTGCTSHVSGSSIIFDGFTLLNTTDSCYYTITATKALYGSSTAQINITRARAGATPSELNLTPSQLSLVANYKGDVTTYVDAKSIAKVTQASTNVTSSWALSKVDSPGIVTKLTDTEIQVLSSVGTQDADCLYALDFDVSTGTLISANIVDTSSRRRKSTLGIDNATYTAAYLPITISTVGPLPGVKSAVLTSSGSGASCIRSVDNTTLSSSDDLVNYLQKNFAFCMYVSFDNVSSTGLQTIYSTSNYQPANISTMGPLRLIKTASTNRIDLVAYNYTGYTTNQVLLSTPATLVNDVFYHVAVSYNSVTRKLVMYLDGVLCGSITAATLSSGLGTGCINLGGIPFATANTGMNGKIALFRYWSSDKFSTNFDKLLYSYKIPTSIDLLADKIVLGLNFENGKVEELKGNVLTTAGNLSYYTDADGTGVIITGGTLNTGLLSTLKLTDAYCIELKYKCLSGFDFATTVNTPVAFLTLADKDNNSRFEYRICNPGVLGTAYASFSMRDGPSSAVSVHAGPAAVQVTDTVYHVFASMEPTTGYSSRYFNGTRNGTSNTGGSVLAWYHAPGIEEYSLQLGNTQVNKGSKWVLYWLRITSGSRRYDYDSLAPAHLETFNTSAYTDVIATKDTETLTKRLSISKQISGEAPSIFTYDPSAATVATDAYGWATSLPFTNMSILVGNTLDTGNWTKTITTSSGLAGTISTNSLLVNSFTATNNVHVMLRGDDNNDVSEYRKTITASASGSAGVPSIATDWSPFGGPGNHYKFSNTTGSNNQQYLTSNIAASIMQIGSQDFTLEMFFSTPSDPTASTFKVPFWHRGDTDALLYGSDIAFIYSQTSGWQVSCSPNYAASFGGGSATVFNYTTAPALVQNKTYHLAIVRSGTNIYLFINGIRYTAGSTVLTSGYTFYNTGQPLKIGFLPGGAYNSTMRFAQIRYTLGVARYTGTTLVIPTEPFSSETPDSGYLDVTANKIGYTSLVKRFVVTKSKANAPTKASAIISCSTPLITLAGDIYGSVPSFSGATATASITIGGVNDTANWTISHTKSSVDIGTSITGDTISITSITNVLDSGWVEFSATRNFGSWPTLIYRVSINKTKLLTPTYVTGETFIRDDLRYNRVASVSIKFTTDGKIMTKNSSGAYTLAGSWYTPNTTAIGTGKYFRYNVTGSAVTGETANTWLELSIDRALTLSVSSGSGSLSSSLAIDISTSSGGSPIVSTNYALLDVESYV